MSLHTYLQQVLWSSYALFLYKPANSSTREYVACIVEMNEWLTELLPVCEGEQATKIPKDTYLKYSSLAVQIVGRQKQMVSKT